MKRALQNNQQTQTTPSHQDWIETTRRTAFEALALRRTAYHQLCSDIIAEDTDTARFIAQLKVQTQQHLHNISVRRRTRRHIAVALAASFVAAALTWHALKEPNRRQPTLARSQPAQQSDEAQSNSSAYIVVSTAEAEPRLKIVRTLEDATIAIARTRPGLYTALDDSKLTETLLASGINGIRQTEDGLRICKILPSGNTYSMTLPPRI